MFLLAVQITDIWCAQTTPKLAKKAKTNLDGAYSHLGGNAFGYDKKGRPKKDDSTMASEMQASGHGSEDYNAFVFYEFEVA